MLSGHFREPGHDEAISGVGKMTGDAIDAVRIALYYTLLLATPVLGVGLIVGLVVSLVQAVTQVQ